MLTLVCLYFATAWSLETQPNIIKSTSIDIDYYEYRDKIDTDIYIQGVFTTFSSTELTFGSIFSKNKRISSKKHIKSNIFNYSIHSPITKFGLPSHLPPWKFRPPCKLRPPIPNLLLLQITLSVKISVVCLYTSKKWSH